MPETSRLVRSLARAAARTAVAAAALGPVAAPSGAQDWRSEYGGSSANANEKCAWVKAVRNDELVRVWDRAYATYRRSRGNPRDIEAKIARVEGLIAKFEKDRVQVEREIGRSKLYEGGTYLFAAVKTVVDTANLILGVMNGANGLVGRFGPAGAARRFGTDTQGQVLHLVDHANSKVSFLQQLEQGAVRPYVEYGLSFVPVVGSITGAAANFQATADMLKRGDEYFDRTRGAMRSHLDTITRGLRKLRATLAKAKQSLRQRSDASARLRAVNKWQLGLADWLRRNCGPANRRAEDDRERMRRIAEENEAKSRRDAAGIDARGLGAGNRAASRYGADSRRVEDAQIRRQRAINDATTNALIQQMNTNYGSGGGGGGGSGCDAGGMRIAQNYRARLSSVTGICSSSRLTWQMYSALASHYASCPGGAGQAATYRNQAAQAQRTMQSSCVR